MAEQARLIVRRVTERAPEQDGTRNAGLPRPEDGFTLVELLVVMPFLLIVTALVLTTVVTAFGAQSARDKRRLQSSSQVTLAFIALDGELRYASDINQPGQDRTTPQLLRRSRFDWKTNSQGEPQCTQLEYDNSSGNLQQRSWYLGGTVPTGWQVLASGLADLSLQRPVRSVRPSKLHGSCP